MSRQKESPIWKVLSWILGSVLLVMLGFSVFLLVSQHISKLDPAEWEEASHQEAADLTGYIPKDQEGFALRIGVPAPSVSEQVTQQTVPVNPPTVPSQTPTASASEYLCPESSTTYLTTAAVNTLITQYNGTMPDGKSVPQMIINEIYAKHGYLFKNQVLQAYFNQKSWYYGTTSDMQQVTDRLNAIEKANVDFLRNNYTG